jgi:8-oxo-dGTP pyrophosphatase MutT (NUDIX family)
MNSEVHKAMAIPFTVEDGEFKFLIVKDKRFKEWTFVTGGCRKREIFNPIRCALRELEEETRGIINLKKGTYNYFKFTTRFEPLEESIYHVYLLPVKMTKDDMYRIVQKFDDEKAKMDSNQVSFRKNYDENDYLDFTSLSELKTMNIWKLVDEKIINNPDFYSALNSPKSKNFYIVY